MPVERSPFRCPDPNVPGPFQDKVRQAFLDNRLNEAFFNARVAAGKRRTGLAGCVVVVDDGGVVTAVRRKPDETPRETEIRAIDKAHKIGLRDPVVAVVRYVPTRRELLSQKN